MQVWHNINSDSFWLHCSFMIPNMISLKDVYHILEATVPLYAVMILAYLSVKWWKLFTPDQCAGINKFVSKISIPMLSFHVISTNNPYLINPKLLLADTVQKFLALVVLAVICKTCFRGRFDWIITGFSISTLPNTLIVGIPLLRGMYGPEAVKVLSQIVVLQTLLWYTVLLFLFEYRAAKENAAMISGKTGEQEVQELQTKSEEGQTRDLSVRSALRLGIIFTVGKKLIVNPNTYSSLAGLLWALISYRWHIKLPLMINNSISLISDGGLGMAMFSIGLFTASQSKIIACGTRMMLISTGLRFVVGPAFMAMSSYAIGMRGTLLDIAIVQAALPQGIVPFVYAKEYGLHPDILSTGIITGMAVAVPAALVYYIILSHS